VAGRVQRWAIRMALGARAQVVTLYVRQSLADDCMGSRWSFLHGSSQHDLIQLQLYAFGRERHRVDLLLVPLSLASSPASPCWLPARRAIESIPSDVYELTIHAERRITAFSASPSPGVRASAASRVHLFGHADRST